MKKNYFFILIFLCASLSLPAQKKVHTIGDSTMAEYDETTTDKRGWAQMFQQFFDETITVNNRGKSGASSKSFYRESAYWPSVKKQITEGDYVIIQFAHNDEKNGGMDGDSVQIKTGDTSADYRGTTPYDTYKAYLRKYVNETRELGATPILAGAICRKYFSGNTIRRNGQHDLGDSYSILNADGTISTGNKLPESDNTMDYIYAMKQVADEMEVPFLDITTKTAELYLSYGEAACTSLFFCDGDNTHPKAYGATLIARLVAQEMKAQGILADHIHIDTDLLINPASIDFGKAYIGQEFVREISLSGIGLTPLSGEFTISASEGFVVSKDKNSYSSSISLAYADGSLDYTTIYVKATVAGAGKVEGTLELTNGNHTKSVPLAYEGVDLAGGVPVSIVWELTADDSYTLTGPAVAVAESWSNMFVQLYAEPKSGATTWPEGSGIADRKTQRNLINGEAWPGGEIDEVSTRYIQFGITAAENTILHIDSIGLYVGGAGGNGMRCRVSYSTSADFANPVVIAEYASSMVSNTMYAVQAVPVMELAAGESLYVRAYPWYTSAATGKTFCISNVTIRGAAESTSAVKEAVVDALPVHTLYYNICGSQLGEAPASGLYLEKVIYSDGTVIVNKIIK